MTLKSPRKRAFTRLAVEMLQGKEGIDRLENAKCVTCGVQIHERDFKDELSKKEFGISGMCQTCQDSVFGG